MSSLKHRWKAAWMLAAVLVFAFCMTAGAESLSNDNSLASLGILTEGAEVSPEFGYGTTEYDVTVPEGTQKLELEPVTSHENAWIVDITGTELTDGKATVEILVSAESGEQYPYYLNVTASGAAAGGTAGTAGETEAQTEPQTETETEPQTEDPRYVKVDRNSLQEAENTISTLKSETTSYRDRVGILMKILYGMIAFCVVLLFVVINLILKKKDLKSELNEYRGLGYPQGGMQDYPENQGYDSGAYGNAEYADQEYENQDYAAWGYGEQGYESQDYGNQDYYEQDAYRQPQEEPEVKPKKKAALKDDPATVPKPAKAKKQPRRMPEYEQPKQQEYSYQQPQEDAKDKKVELTMIDL